MSENLCLKQRTEYGVVYFVCQPDTPEKQVKCKHYAIGSSDYCAYNQDADICSSFKAQTEKEAL